MIVGPDEVDFSVLSNLGHNLIEETLPKLPACKNIVVVQGYDAARRMMGMVDVCGVRAALFEHRPSHSDTRRVEIEKALDSSVEFRKYHGAWVGGYIVETGLVLAFGLAVDLGWRNSCSATSRSRRVSHLFRLGSPRF